MIGIGDHEYAAIRFDNLVQEVLRPAIHPHQQPLELALHQPPGRPALAEVRDATFQPCAVGHRWGPVWSTAWFRLRGTVPATFRGREVGIRFSSGTEALLYRDGLPVQGLDANRDYARLWESVDGEHEVDLLVEAACNLPLGASTFWWDHPEHAARWRESAPGRVEVAALVQRDDAMWRFTETYDWARRLLLVLPDSSARAKRLLRGLRDLTRDIDPDHPRSALPLLEPLHDLLRGSGSTAATTCHAVGHAHIDTAWLWPIAETRRKVTRSWSNVLSIMDVEPTFQFMASQPQQYAWLEQDAPSVFQRLTQRVAEGRWEPTGAMWVEPDCTAPSGESLVRQILHGTAWFEARFGDHAPQRMLYLPDTFGFPATLPQIARLAGLDTFITNKMSWCERNEFPFVTFRWRGLDGTELLSHFTPGKDYNAPLQPDDLTRGEQHYLAKDETELGRRTASPPHWLQPFGYGDGGGGPTREMALRSDLCDASEGLPKVVPSRADAFCELLHVERARELAASERDLPVWDGELYLELHRGTASSHRWLKQANARAERRLRLIEALLTQATAVEAAHDLRPQRDAAWKVVLLHQFHDILPGTSIKAVYDDARCAYDDLEHTLEALESAAWAAQPPSVCAFHPGSQARSILIEEDGVPVGRATVGPLARVHALTPNQTPDVPAQLTRLEDGGLRLVNGCLDARLDDAGRVASLACVGGPPINALGENGDLIPLQQLVLHDDRPRRWEAWDVDHDHADRATPLADPCAWRVVEEGPWRVVVEFERTVGAASRVVIRYTLEAESPQLDVTLDVDWHETRKMLRVEHPTAIRARHATCGIPWGHLERPTHRNTARDEAQFEVSGHGWMDLSVPGLGFAVLDDAVFGRSIQERTLSLTLLRSPVFPDATADRGSHVLRTALVPHDGDWRGRGIPALAEAFVQPLAWAPPKRTRHGEERLPLVENASLGDGAAELVACKPAEDGDGWIVRLVERHGGHTPVALHWGPPVDAAVIDLRERSPGAAPIPADYEHTPHRTTCTLRPFEVVSLRLRPT